jgi:hypothetical protein
VQREEDIYYEDNPMEQDRFITKREGLRSALLLSIAANLGLAAGLAQAQQTSLNGKALVAY